MEILYLILVVAGVSAQNTAKKEYSKRTGSKGVYLFGIVSTFAAAMFFLLSCGDMHINGKVLPYAVAFSALYAMSVVFSTLAVSSGPLSITALIISYSLILPTLFGLLFLHEPIRMGLLPGLCFLLVSLLLINRKSESISITPKWVLYAVLAFVGNGGCSIVQKLQQAEFDGAYKNEFMFLALSMVLLVLLVPAFLKERKQAGMCMRKGGWIAAACGIMNGVVNLLVMLLSGKMPVSIMFPVISAGGVVATFIISVAFYRERLSKAQLVGFALGAVSVVLLNL